MKIPRTSRLDSEFQKEISSIISRELKDREPDLSGIISVTSVEVAPDLKTARVFVSIYAKDEAHKKASFDAIKGNAAFIRHCLAKVMHIRTVPVLTFLWDGSMEYGSKIDELLKQVHTEINNEDGSNSVEEDK